MRKLLLIALAFGLPLVAASDVVYIPSSGLLPGGIPTPDIYGVASIDYVFPSGATHVWKMEESSGNRLDSVGTAHMVPTGTGFSRVAGIDGYAMAGDGNGGTRPGDILTSEMTIAVWGRIVTSGFVYWFGPQSEVSLVYSDTGPGTVSLSVYDQFSGENSTAGNTSGTITTADWVLFVVRLNNTAKTGSVRWYGFPSNNATTYSLSPAVGSGWVNALISIEPRPLWGTITPGNSYSAGKVDEMVFWDYELTDGECDRLQSWFYPQ